jgi:hypothetical protein
MLAFSQQYSCEEILSYVKSNGYKKSSPSSWYLKSSWLKNVTAYELDDMIFVVADIKKDDWGYSSKEYIFCGVPSRNWDNFYSITAILSEDSYGEKFHKYIIDYVCDCY